MPFHWRFIFTLLLLIFCFLGLGFRVLDLSHFSRDYYKKLMDSVQQTKKNLLKNFRSISFELCRSTGALFLFFHY
jgi:hypothetical protein